MLELICKELGVGIGEIWLANNGTEYQIGEKGELFYKITNNVWAETNCWTAVLNGEIKPRWRPKDGERYYIPEITNKNLFGDRFWNNTSTGDHLLKNGLIFKTKEEAIEAANKMLELWKER